MSTTITPVGVGRTGGRVLDWHEPALVDLDRRPVAKAVLMGVMVTFGALVDAGLMRPAIMRVLRDTPTMAGIISVALAGVGATAAATAGTSWRGARGNNPGRWSALVLPAAIVLVWSALGAGIAWLRVGAANITTTAGYDGQSAPVGAATSDMIAAVLFLIVYILVGALAFADAFEWRNDAFTAKVRAQRKLDPALKGLAETEALLVRLVENLQIRKHELATNPTDAMTAKRSNAALAAELEQVSRDEQMIGHGDATKSGITSAQHPDNPHPTHT